MNNPKGAGEALLRMGQRVAPSMAGNATKSTLINLALDAANIPRHQGSGEIEKPTEESGGGDSSDEAETPKLSSLEAEVAVLSRQLDRVAKDSTIHSMVTRDLELAQVKLTAYRAGQRAGRAERTK